MKFKEKPLISRITLRKMQEKQKNVEINMKKLLKTQFFLFLTKPHFTLYLILIRAQFLRFKANTAKNKIK